MMLASTPEGVLPGAETAGTASRKPLSTQPEITKPRVQASGPALPMGAADPAETVQHFADAVANRSRAECFFFRPIKFES